MSSHANARTICIVAPGYISSMPRVVKEADALAAAGYRVRVVSSQGDVEHVRPNDQLVADQRRWRWDVVGWSRHRSGERRTYWRSTARQRAFAAAPAWAWQLGNVAERADGQLYPELARRASSEHADLYIGHYPAGLAAAAAAARRHDALFAYDVEDLHTGEHDDTAWGRGRAARIDFIESRYANDCAHITASSPGIASAFARRRAMNAPTVVHNVFPWQDRLTVDREVRDRRGDTLSLYWCSQSVGVERGLVDAMVAIGLLGGPVQLHVRGTISSDTLATLSSIAAANGVAEHVTFHPQVSPGELLSRTMEHDVGLALEQGHTANNCIAASNKLFLYMLAGLAVAATDVPGQRAIADVTPDAVRLYPPGEPARLAEMLERWRRDPDALAADRAAALDAARSRWNWEREQAVLIDAVDATLRVRRTASYSASGAQP
ncbi:MAG: hypothetical protein JWM41_2261 [Gemmatimonadetes bacterium]|nr:hypothetical protein [Gemmatimonadota bacterium]